MYFPNSKHCVGISYILNDETGTARFIIIFSSKTAKEDYFGYSFNTVFFLVLQILEEFFHDLFSMYFSVFWTLCVSRTFHLPTNLNTWNIFLISIL